MRRSLTFRAAAVLATGLLGAGLAACSTDEGQDAAPSAGSQAEGTTTMETSEGSTSGTSSSATYAERSGEAPTVALDGNEVVAPFQPVKCEWGTDDGHPQLEYDAGQESTGGDLEVEIVMSDPPKLDDFSLETDEVDWKAHSEQRDTAQITVDGDTYRVVSQASEENGTRTADLDVTFTCTKQ